MTPSQIKQKRKLHHNTLSMRFVNKTSCNVGPGHLKFESKLPDDKIEELKKALEAGYKGGSNLKHFKVESLQIGMTPSKEALHDMCIGIKRARRMNRRRMTELRRQRRKIGTFYKLRRTA